MPARTEKGSGLTAPFTKLKKPFRLCVIYSIMMQRRMSRGDFKVATNRYGQIWHGDHHINIRFPSTEARLKFQNEFEAYHASHDHEGDIPTFRCVSSKDLKLGTGDRSPQDLVKAETDKDYRITIDGYSWNEIHDYHNPSGLSQYTWYRVPTCCVPPIIVIDREFVDSDTLQRHELSAFFEDMPADHFQSLIDGVQKNGFIDPIIRIYEGQILDGWHRYRAAQELNLIRKLRFQEWKEDDHRDGDPRAFVYERNLNRRHYSAAQRAQVAVTFSKRFGHGGDRKSDASHLDDGLKSREALAKETGVGIATIDRAIVVEKAGQARSVIAGKKTAGEVLEEQKAERDNEREAAIAVVKPRFQKAVETWRSLQVERLRKFEDLPVGRTPLIESEYIKTYFELAQPRIPQNTKPTAAHYESAIECMRDLPVDFAEQLEGRHYRRIIKEWDSSVLLQLVERFQSGHILAYPALQTDSDANARRIQKAIRDHYGFQGRITSQPFEVFFEITEDAHAVLVQLNPKEWMREGREISWALSVLPEPTYEKVLAENRDKAQDACVEMWKAFEKSDLSKYLDREDFMGVAAKEYQCTSDFPDPMNMKQPEIWVIRFDAIKRSLEEKSEWVQRVLGDFSEVEASLPDFGTPVEKSSEVPHHDESDQTTARLEHREASKLLKEKKQALKLMWDKRIRSAKDYAGDGDTDLNQYLSLSDLEKGFAKYEAHDYCADAFRSALQRTSETSFNIVVEKTLKSDVSLEVLQEEAQAMDTYAYDILQWQKQDWIQQLIEKKRNAQSQKAERLEEQQQLARDTQKLRITIQEYLLDTGLTYQIGLDSVFKKLAKDYQLRDNFYEPEPSGTLSDDLQSEHNTLAAVFVDLQNPNSTLRKELDALTAEPEPDNLDLLWEVFDKRFPKWKAKYAESGYKENDLIQAATESDLFDALRVYRESEYTGKVTADEIKDVTALMKSQSYVFARQIRDVLRGKVQDKEGLSKEFKRIFTLHNRFDRDIVDCRALGETYRLHEEDVRESMEIFQRELGALEKKVRTEIKSSSSDISVEDIADRVEVDDIEVVRAMIAKIQLDETNRPSTPSAPAENLPLQNALDEMKVDAETFDWNAVRPDFDPEKHEWLQVVIQRGTNHTTVSKIPTGPAHFTYGKPETEVVVEKGLFPQEKLREIIAELSEIFAKWVADKSE